MGVGLIVTKIYSLVCLNLDRVSLADAGSQKTIIDNPKSFNIMLHELNKAGIEHVLNDRIYGHIGCHSNGLTYVVPICYAYESERIFGRTYEGLKLKILRENPTVCFQVEHIESMLKWQSVICWGEFKELTSRDKQLQAIKVLQDRVLASVEINLEQSSYWPFDLSENKEQGVLFCIELKLMTGRDFFVENPIK